MRAERDHSVEYRLDAPVSEGGAGEAGVDGPGDGALAERGPDLSGIGVFAAEDHVFQARVELCRAQEHGLDACCGFSQLIRDRRNSDL